MKPITQPEAHQLYHPRQYPPYAPSVAARRRDRLSHRGVLTLLSLVVVALLAAAGLAKFGGADPSDLPAVTGATEYQPSEAALLYAEEPSREAVEPLHPSPAEQQLTRALAELDVEMGRTERLAGKLGQSEAFGALRTRYQELSAEVAARPHPWSELDLRSLEREAGLLRADLARFSGELHDIATVRL